MANTCNSISSSVAKTLYLLPALFLCPFVAAAYSGSGDDSQLYFLLGFAGLVLLLSFVLPIASFFTSRRWVRIVAWICVVPVLAVAFLLGRRSFIEGSYFVHLPTAAVALLLLRELRNVYGPRYAVLYVAAGALILTAGSGLGVMPGLMMRQFLPYPYLSYLLDILITGILIYQLLRRMRAYGLGAPDMTKSILYALAISIAAEVLQWSSTLYAMLFGGSYFVFGLNSIPGVLIQIVVCMLGGAVGHAVYEYRMRAVK